MKPKHDVKFLKNLGQFVIAPIIGLLLAIAAVIGGSISGGFAILFGGFIWMAMTFVVLVIFDKFVIKKAVAENERYEREYKEKIRRLMEMDNDPDAYEEYDNTGFVDDRFEEEKTGIDEYQKQIIKEKEERQKAREDQDRAVLRELDYGENDLKDE